MKDKALRDALRDFHLAVNAGASEPVIRALRRALKKQLAKKASNP